MIDVARKLGDRLRARPVIAGICALLVLVCLSVIAVRWPRGPELQEVGGEGGFFGASLPSTRAGRPLSIGASVLCLSEPGVAYIDAITAVEPHQGLAVTDFRVRPIGGGDLFGAEEVPLDRSGFGGTRRVTTPCRGLSAGAELAVEFTKPVPGNARAKGVLVRWHSARRSGSFTIPIHIVLCEGPNQEVAQCDASAHD